MRSSTISESIMSKKNENIRAKVVTDVNTLTTASLFSIHRNHFVFVEFQTQQQIQSFSSLSFFSFSFLLSSSIEKKFEFFEMQFDNDHTSFSNAFNFSINSCEARKDLILRDLTKQS